MKSLGLGGSCHWCTEGVFSSLIGVFEVEQGWISSLAPDDDLSEGIVLKYDSAVINIAQLVAVHLHSHSCTSEHSMRRKYRSAVYYTDGEQRDEIRSSLEAGQKEFSLAIITRDLPLVHFKLNEEEFLDYYHRNPDKPFCRTYVKPKLRKIMARYPEIMDAQQTAHIAAE